MKIAITGKGGTGKTSVAAGLAVIFKNQGKKVIAIDADPDANLATALGIPAPERPVPIAGLKKLIVERTGEVGAFFKMNPKVDDIPDKFSRSHNGIRVMEMGTVKKGGAGCVCPESAFLKALLSHMVLNRGEVVVVDMEAGVEHLGRGTAQAVDKFMVIVEPNITSINTARRIKALAENLSVKELSVVVNMVRSRQDEDFVAKNLKDLRIEGFVKFDENLAGSRGILPEDSQFIKDLEEVVDVKANR